MQKSKHYGDWEQRITGELWDNERLINTDVEEVDVLLAAKEQTITDGTKGGLLFGFLQKVSMQDVGVVSTEEIASHRHG